MDRKIYGVVNLHSKVFFEMVHSLLLNLNKKIKRKALMNLNSFKILLFNKEIHIIVKLNFYFAAFAHFKLTNQNRAGIYNFPQKEPIRKIDIPPYQKNPTRFFIDHNIFVNRVRKRRRKRSFNQVQLYKNKSNREYGKLLV